MPDPDAAGFHAMRRVGGARVAVSKKVRLLSYGQTEESEGWALNLSQGGVRLICEQPLAVGDRVVIELGDEDDPESLCRPARVVWVHQELDGVVAGLEFTDTLAPKAPSVPPPDGASSNGPGHAPPSAAHEHAGGQGAARAEPEGAGEPET